MDATEVSGWVKLGALVRSTRVGRGLTQAEVSARARVSRSWLARVEAGHRNAELEPLLRLLDALDLRMLLASTSDLGAPATGEGRDPVLGPQHAPASGLVASSGGLPLAVRRRINAATRTRRQAWGLPPSRSGTDTDDD